MARDLQDGSPKVDIRRLGEYGVSPTGRGLRRHDSLSGRAAALARAGGVFPGALRLGATIIVMMVIGRIRMGGVLRELLAVVMLAGRIAIRRPHSQKEQGDRHHDGYGASHQAVQVVEVQCYRNRSLQR